MVVMEKLDPQASGVLRYKHNRFTATFAADRLYSKAHYWFSRQENGTFQVGLTKFAARMLGELVEFGFEVKPGAKISEGDILGWLEGFKAASDIYAFVDGTFIGENHSLVEQPELLHARPHNKGWLYEISFDKEEESKLLTVHEYTIFLDELIDKMTGDEE